MYDNVVVAHGTAQDICQLYDGQDPIVNYHQYQHEEWSQEARRRHLALPNRTWRETFRSTC